MRMKKFSTLLLSLALGSTLAAQTPKFTPERGALLDGKTIVKANITSPIFKNYSFAAERILTKGLSLQLSIATMPKGALPFSSSFENHIGHDVSMSSVKLQSFYVTPELRWYTGGGYGHGFYLMAYYRYQNYKLSGYTLNMDVREGASSSDKRVALDLTGDLKTNSFGFGLGAQWLFGRNKNIVLDWNILGVHAGKGKLTLAGDYSATNLSDKEIEDLQKQISENVSDLPTIKLVGQDVNVDKASKKVSIDNVSTPWAWLRASVSLGFRF